MVKKNNYFGTLIGMPFVSSIDTTGFRTDKEKCALLVKGFLIPTGYKAYIFDDTYPVEYVSHFASKYSRASILHGVTLANNLVDYDIVCVSENGVMEYLYRNDSLDNVLFTTNACNSNCIMCPDSMKHRMRHLNINQEYLLNLIDLIPNDTNYLTITGGEPTLLKWNLLELLQKCREKFEHTSFLMLSNGRSFCVKDYRVQFIRVLPFHFRLAIPLYGSTAKLHDSITQVCGSFAQTSAGMRALQNELELEIRIVIMKVNYQHLPDIARYIIETFPKTCTVSFMGMELLGNAAINQDMLWINFPDTAPFIEEAAILLIHAGIDAKIYNYPLCSLPEHLWSLAAKSISDYKVRYQPQCESCEVKPYCGGFFFSTITCNDIRTNPIIGGNLSCH
ncbi:MAG: His-Xaa-Ser system radical SAM maturase HxsC [Anaerovorax sp.]